MAKENERGHDEFASTFSSMDANFVTRTNELHAAVNGNISKSFSFPTQKLLLASGRKRSNPWFYRLVDARP